MAGFFWVEKFKNQMYTFLARIDKNEVLEFILSGFGFKRLREEKEKIILFKICKPQDFIAVSQILKTKIIKYELERRLNDPKIRGIFNVEISNWNYHWQGF